MDEIRQGFDKKWYIARLSKRKPNKEVDLALEKKQIPDSIIRAIAISWLFEQIEGCKKGIEMEVTDREETLDLTLMRRIEK